MISELPVKVTPVRSIGRGEACLSFVRVTPLAAVFVPSATCAVDDHMCAPSQKNGVGCA